MMFHQFRGNCTKKRLKVKKEKKSRLDRELEALIVKWSHLKKAMGLNKLKDIYLTLTSKTTKGGNMTLS